MAPERVFVVRSGPDLARLKRLAPDERLKCGRRYLVGYVGVMGRQEGVDYLLRAVQHIVFGLHRCDIQFGLDRKSTRLNSSHSQISYAVFCLKKKMCVNWQKASRRQASRLIPCSHVSPRKLTH